MTNDLYYVPYEKISVNDSATDEIMISDQIVKKFSALIGDNNSFHVSDENAQKTIFKKRIAHGIHLAAFISTLIGKKLPGFGTIYCNQQFEFKKPVFIGEIIKLEIKVLEKMSKNRIRMSTIIRNEHNEIVITGECIVKTYK